MHGLTAKKNRARDAWKSGTVAADLTRRGFGAGMLATLCGGLLAKPADAFPRGADADFKRATKILSGYGLSISGAFDEILNHDVLTTTSVPLNDTQYDFVVGQLNEVSGIIPCSKTSFFQGAAEFTAFDENPAGGILPCTKTTVVETRTTFGQLDTNQAGGIIPCLKTTIEGSLATHELFDLNEAGGIVPCIVVGAERLADGSLGPAEVTVNDPALNFTVRIGPRTYRLVDGGLVEDAPR
jgi:hypothetical protein